MKNQGGSKKVFVGLSGGVDSATSAAILKKANYDVHGVFIKVWQPDWMPCTAAADRLDAMRVAAHLNIPFHDLDLEKEYKKEVVDYMVREYKEGRTPNPDVMCNTHVKFGAFYNWAMANGADFIATGHYAQIKNGNGGYQMLKAVDQNKDQTYFIWNIKEAQLKHILFPVGHLIKDDVRKLAKKFGLPVSLKKDSQGLCFIGKVDFKEFLKHFVKEKPGHVLDMNENIIGKHHGAMFFTLGERHGFIITRKSSNDKPYYIVKKDMNKNTITVSNNPLEIACNNNQIKLSNTNWINFKPHDNIKVLGRVRYRQPLHLCLLQKKNDGWYAKIKSDTPPTSGQSLVLYDRDACIGGGIIR